MQIIRESTNEVFEFPADITTDEIERRCAEIVGGSVAEMFGTVVVVEADPFNEHFFICCAPTR